MKTSVDRSLTHTNPQRVGEAVAKLLHDAGVSENEDRRADVRHPFFCPVSVSTCDGQKRWSAFCREISRGGIGLLHNMPLEPGEVTLSIASGEQIVKLRAELIWCRPCGEGWYMSGGRFLDVEAR